jgi:hypothetical protein
MPALALHENPRYLPGSKLALASVSWQAVLLH